MGPVKVTKKLLESLPVDVIKALKNAILTNDIELKNIKDNKSLVLDELIR